MKISHSTILFLIRLSVVKVDGQSSFPGPSFIWTEAQYDSFFGGVSTMYYTFDSLQIHQNGKDYYEILVSDKDPAEDWQQTGILIRSEGQKLYLGISSGEVIMLDYNLDTNDIFISNMGMEYTVVAIDSISLANGERRKRLEMHCDVWGPFYWIEGIGSTTGLALYGIACYYDVGSALLCFYENEVLLFDHPDFETCWLNIVATNELEEHHISFFPNPLSDQLYIQDPDEQIVLTLLFTQHGKLAYSGRDLQMNTPGLSAGSYFLQMILKSGQTISEVIIKH